MKTVQLMTDHNGRRKGEVLNVDDGSAASLIDGKVAEEYNGKGEVVPATVKPGVVHVVQVADADTPAAAPEAAEAAPEAAASAPAPSTPPALPSTDKTAAK